MILNKGIRDWALIAIDIQKFKYVNEVLGYLEGDNILKSFARHFPPCSWTMPIIRG